VDRRHDERTAGIVVSREPLVGRESERRRVDDLLERIRAKQSPALLVEGESGVGKSALLHYAMANAADMRVAFTSAVELEAELPFATLTALLAPFASTLDDLPPTQRAVLDAALGRGGTAPVDRLAVGAVTLGCLSLAAETASILLVVDDGHWADPSSAEALLFAFRRLEREAVGMVVASREGESHCFADAGLPTVRLGGLDGPAAMALVRRSMAPEVTESIVGPTGGNPLAILDLRDTLTEAQRRGREPLPDPLPIASDPDQIARRTRRLSDTARRLLTLAAAGGGLTVGVLLTAARALEIDPTTLDEVMSSGLVALMDNRVVFPHTWLRSSVYEDADEDDRRRSHQALAVALRREDDLDRRAWHLAAAAAEPDEHAAHALEESARSAHRRGAFAIAGEVYDRAAALSPSEEDRGRRLAAAGDSFWLAGRSARALTAFDEALELANDPVLRAEVQLKGAASGLLTRSLRPLHEELVARAADVERFDRTKASALLAQAAMTALTSGRVNEARRTADRAVAIAPNESAVARGAAVTVAMAQLAIGEVQAAVPALEAFLVEFESEGPHARWFGVAEQVANGLMWTERFAAAAPLLDGLIQLARTSSAPARLPLALSVRAELSFWAGAWRPAAVDAWEAASLARETEQTVLLSYPLVTLARIHGGLGRAGEAFGHLEEARQSAEASGNETMLHLAHAAQGFIELGLAHLEEARAHLELTASFSATGGFLHPSSVTWLSDLVEVLARIDDKAASAEALHSLEEVAMRLPGAWPRGALARSRGMLSSTGFDDHFEEALSALEAVPVPFEQARTELCFGERLRRMQLRTEATRHLWAAREVFVQLGAGPWIARTDSELAACGERTSLPRPTRLEALTPQELRVAAAIAAGATNREVAAALFLSRRTVEHHLGSVYRKLGVHSRSQLVGVLARDGLLDELAQ
jgi:DNA-binding CsgD family transcriptional regulator/tetratricopeptide (TPR) repeat protein